MEEETAPPRPRARRRLPNGRDPAEHALTYLLVNALLLLAWYVTGHGWFWPAYPLVGWGLGLLFDVWVEHWPERPDLPTPAELLRRPE